MLDNILKIGPLLSAQKLDTDQFNIKSLNILNELKIDCDLESFSRDLAQWLTITKIPRQLNVYNTFGQPPVTLFNNEQFVIDLYFWMEADTSLHSHAFNGAFKVLFGKSLHEIFQIETIKNYAPDVVLNNLKKDESEILAPGDSRVIQSGTDFNHRVVHLGQPTVSLCIRTISDVNIPQWHYFDNGLSILKHELEQSVYKKLFYADYLSSINQEDSFIFLEAFVKATDASKLINLYEQLTVDTMGLSELTQETLYNFMMERFNKELWFPVYEQACDTTPEEIHGHNEKQKLLAHLEYHDYSEDETQKLLSALI